MANIDKTTRALSATEAQIFPRVSKEDKVQEIKMPFPNRGWLLVLILTILSSNIRITVSQGKSVYICFSSLYLSRIFKLSSFKGELIQLQDIVVSQTFYCYSKSTVFKNKASKPVKVILFSVFGVYWRPRKTALVSKVSHYVYRNSLSAWAFYSKLTWISY